MRKVLLICVVVSLLGTGTALAAEQVISGNPLGLLIGASNVEYERAIDEDSAWAVRGLFWSDDEGHWEWTAFGAGARYRRYFEFPDPTAPGIALSGWYWGAGVDMLSVSAERTRPGIVDTGSAVFFGPVGEVGYRWLFEEGFAVGVGAELGFLIGTLEVAGEPIPIGDIVAGLTFNLGYAW